jgi:hypothetical protein
MFKTLILAYWEIASVVDAPQPPEHNADTQVDWANSFWDMTKCLKRYSANW